jgi:hypothetical protein
MTAFVGYLQAVEHEHLPTVDGIRVEVEPGLDDMGFHRVSVFGPSREAVIDYVRENWGDDDEEWFVDYVVDRVGELHDFLVQVEATGEVFPPAVDDRGDLHCPVCDQVLTMSQWADDGEADLADWWDCQTYGGGCGAKGALVVASDPTLTQNGLPVAGEVAAGLVALDALLSHDPDVLLGEDGESGIVTATDYDALVALAAALRRRP